ncbi:hypothetical protein ACMD2_25528 [Ananas comosus]|uniref:Uncharacterized protein n=1 Tax=Ananas comosus TaxID=4615 RepID=A0A199ULJ6_ANACO|nr:hypothetical protein ACMD2_25528 [Ananas comosus]
MNGVRYVPEANSTSWPLQKIELLFTLRALWQYKHLYNLRSALRFSSSIYATRLFGLGDEFSEDAMLGKLEGMKDVIEQVNRQFKDPYTSWFEVPPRAVQHVASRTVPPSPAVL